MRTTIEVVVAPDGTVSITTKGFQGAGCLKATADLEKSLGKVTSEKKTAEYLKPEQGRVNQ